MEVKATSPIGITVGTYLKYKIGNVNIEHVKTVLVPFVGEKKLIEIHVASDLFDYFNKSGSHDFTVIETLKHLLTKLNREDLVQYVEAYEFLLRTLIGTSGAENFYNIYRKISTEIENRIGCKDASALKQEYEHVINSVRTLHAIQNVRDLFSVLEDRDILNSSDVSILENILDKCGEATLKKLVQSYKIIFHPSPLCEICGYDGSCKQQLSSPVNTEDSEELQVAFTYLCKNLGPEWKKLARSLKINEAKIKSIQKENILDVEEQTMAMLNHWKQSYDDASVACLVSALRSRMCSLMYLANEIENKTYKDF